MEYNSKGRIKEISIGASFKPSIKFQSGEISMYLTKEFPEDVDFDFDKEVELMKEQIFTELGNQLPDTIDSLKDLAALAGK